MRFDQARWECRRKQAIARQVMSQAVLAAWMVIAFAGGGWAQTLARPRWAGSGMMVERWWQQAVLLEVRPGEAGTGDSKLEEITARLDEVQTLGADAILLRGVDVSGGGDSASGGAGATRFASPLNGRYGSIEQFDELITEASRRRLRVLVELPSGTLTGDALVSRARFWLSRGVTGLYLSSGPAAGVPGMAIDARAQIRALRSVLHGFVGERVLLEDAAAVNEQAGPVAAGSGGRAGAGLEGTAGRGRRGGRSRTIHTVQSSGTSTADGPDLVLMPLLGFGDRNGAGLDLATLRGSLEALAQHRARSEPVSEIVRPESAASMVQARAEATVLLSARGGVALGTDDLGSGAGEAGAADGVQRNATGLSRARELAGSVTTAIPDPLFAWTSRMVGLHRGNATMRDGVQSVLNHDADGALVMVWRGGGARPQVLVEVVNLTEKPLSLSLVGDVAGLRLRGSFLRTVLRSDGGMGAMPLRAVRLPGYGVYLGELGR